MYVAAAFRCVLRATCIHGGGCLVSWRALFVRHINDILFFVLVPVIMLSIVSGIIIDSFGSSRDLRSEVNEDQRNKCFICRCAACCSLLAACCWLLAAGCWLLAAGCWLLAACCLLLAACC